MGKKNKDLLKLAKLCSHWAKHNDSHKESFLKWRDIASDNDLQEVSKKLDLAIEAMDNSTQYLLDAKTILEDHI